MIFVNAYNIPNVYIPTIQMYIQYSIMCILQIKINFHSHFAVIHYSKDLIFTDKKIDRHHPKSHSWNAKR